MEKLFIENDLDKFQSCFILVNKSNLLPLFTKESIEKIRTVANVYK